MYYKNVSSIKSHLYVTMSSVCPCLLGHTVNCIPVTCQHIYPNLIYFTSKDWSKK